MFSFVGDIFETVTDVADAVVDVGSGVVGAATGVVGDVLGPIAAAVDAIPIVGDVVDAAAPFGGLIGSVIGGPVGGMIGNAVGDTFGGGDGGGSPFGFLDGALGAITDVLPGPLGDIAGQLTDGGSLIDTATSIFGGGLPDLGSLAGAAGGLLDGDLGGLVGAAGGLLDGDLGGLAGAASGLLGGEAGGLIDAAGGLLDGGADGVMNLLGGASSVFNGLGIGNLSSAVTSAVAGTPAPAGAEGDADGGGLFGFGSMFQQDEYEFPNCWGGTDYGTSIGEGGGDWLDVIAQQAGEVAQQLPGQAGSVFGQVQDNADSADGLGWPFSVITADGNTGVVPPNLGSDPTDILMDPTIQDFPDTDLDDLVFNMPGVNADSAARDALQQLAESGGLGAALAGMAPDDVTALVSRLVTPITPAAEAVQSDNDVIVDIDDGMSIDAGSTTAGVDVGTNDPLGIGIDDITGEPADAGAGAGTDAATNGETGIPDDALIEQPADAATGQVAVDDFSLDGGVDAGGGAGVSAPAEPEFVAPEPVESDFSQSMAQADAAETQLDSDVDAFFTDL